MSSAFISLGHGSNDAQKTMGIIAVLLYSTGYMKGDFHVPLWIVLSCHAAMGLGTLFKIPAAFDAPVIVFYWLITSNLKEDWKKIFKNKLTAQ